MSETPLARLKRYIEEKKNVFLSSDGKYLHFSSENVQSPCSDIVGVKGKTKEVKLSLGQIWFYLKNFTDPTYPTMKEFPIISVRDRVVVQQYFVNPLNNIPKEIFEKPLKRKRGSTEEGVEPMDDLESGTKIRKLNDEQKRAKENFCQYLDKLLSEEDSKKDDKRILTFQEIEDLDIGFQDESFKPFLNVTPSTSSICRRSIEVEPHELVLRGSYYDKISEFSHVKDMFAEIHTQEKNLRDREEKKKKLLRKSKRREKTSSKSGSGREKRKVAKISEKEMTDMGIDPLGYEKTKPGQKKNVLPRRKKHVKAPVVKLVKSEKRRIEPVILVPFQTTSLLTLFNAKYFFCGQTFKTTEECKTGVTRKEKCLKIEHTNRVNRTTTYKIFDNPKNLSSEDWKNVVAMFTNGKTYEFKNFPISFGNDPTTVFSKIKGFHLKYRNKKADPNILKWNVKVLEVDKGSELGHITAKRNFWNIVDL